MDPEQTYRFSAWGRSGDDEGGQFVSDNLQYLGLAYYDADALLISPWHFLRHADAVDARLTQPLRPGDEHVYLDNLDGWSQSGPGYSRSLAWYGYQNAGGYVYPDYTYTRNVLSNAWAAGDIELDNHRIRLGSPWSGLELATGNPIIRFRFDPRSFRMATSRRSLSWRATE